ncbi:MAG TPA: SIS domain-containing protein [Vicinamibacterales bacterium]|nr:SIS domain-containing protein [Vicinamibacterales bacterium]
MTQAAPEYERVLYPFLFDQATSAPERVESLLREVEISTRAKCRDVVELRRRLFAEYAEALVAAGRAMAAAFARGGKLLAFGNGGSATDAQDAAADCLAPPVAGWRPLPALALVNDTAVVTAIANDVGFEHVFVRQIAAFGAPGDLALGISTSGNSRNVNLALAEARRRGLLTIAFSGGDGGAVARERLADFVFVARLEHIPRIQEGHATLWHALLELVHHHLDRGAAEGLR